MNRFTGLLLGSAWFWTAVSFALLSAVRGLAPDDLVCLMLADTEAEAATIVEAWRSKGVLSCAQWSVAVDFLFLFAYVQALVLAIDWAAGQCVEMRDRCGFGRWFTLTAALRLPMLLVAVATGTLDFIENLMMLVTLRGEATAAHIAVTDTAATWKFIGVAACGVYLAFALLLWMIGPLLLRRALDAAAAEAGGIE